MYIFYSFFLHQQLKLLIFSQEIMDVEHLWKFSEAEINKLNQNQVSGNEHSRNDGAGKYKFSIT